MSKAISRILLIMVMALLVVATVSADQAPTAASPGGDAISAAEAVQPQPAAATDASGAGIIKSSRYIVQLDEPSLARYTGGVRGLAATSPAATGAARLDVRTAASQAYTAYLLERHDNTANRIATSIGRDVDVLYNFTSILNAFVVEMSEAEAAVVAKLPGVAMVEQDVAYPVATDYGPAWIGADDVWAGLGDYGENRGEGIVVGILDSGINFDHPSFAAADADGYTHTNPFGDGNYVGWCDPANVPDGFGYDPADFVCNSKLIGMWDFSDPLWGTFDGPDDEDGHGTHVASTVAGNKHTAMMYGATPDVVYETEISGVAPRANIIAYDVCGKVPGSTAPASCFNTSVFAALQQVINDYTVDSINESIGIGGDPFSGLKQLGYLDVYAAGIYASRSAGNSGPGPATVGPEPAWVTSVAAMTHNRNITNSVIDLTSEGGPLADITGLGFAAGYGPAPIVYAGDYPSAVPGGQPALCGVGGVDNGISPWPAGTFNGEIVICDRGTYGRVAKGANVLAAGAGGYILVDNGAGLVGDAHVLPGVHITAADGAALKAWVAASNGTATGSISGFQIDTAASNGDIMAGFSSRGPAPYEMIKPDVGAPGVSILAAYAFNGTGAPAGAPEYAFLGGTSMASPHNAGAAALVRAAHPDWTPGQVRSALQLTAIVDGTLKENGVSPTTPFDLGNGRIDVSRAIQTGLVMDESPINYIFADPNFGGDPKTLNVASMQNNNCYLGCGWLRNFMATMDGTWMIEGSFDNPAISVEVFPSEDGMGRMSEISVAAGESFDAWIYVNAFNAAPNQWYFGSVTMTEASGAAPSVRLPIAIYTVDSTDATLITKEASTSATTIGSPIDYTITVGNAGGVTRTVEVEDFIPAGTVYVPGSATGFTIIDGKATFLGDVGPTTLDLLSIPGYAFGYFPLGGLGVTPLGCGVSTGNCDDGAYNFAAGPFNFMGESYSNFQMSTNGVAYLGSRTYTNDAGGGSLPNLALAGNPILAAFWADLDPSSGGALRAANLTAGPNNFFVVEWSDVPRFGDGASRASMQIWYWRQAGVFWFAYPASGAGWVGTHNVGTIGAMDASGAVGDMLWFDGNAALPSDEVVIATQVGSLELGFSVLPTEAGELFNEAMLFSEAGYDYAYAKTMVYPNLMPNGLTTGFEGGIPGDFLVINNGDIAWTVTGQDTCVSDDNYTNGSGLAACVNSDAAGSGVEYDTELWSPMFSLEGYSIAALNFTMNYQNIGLTDIVDVDVSTDGGVSWTNLVRFNEDHGSLFNTPGEDFSLDLSAYAGEPMVWVRWHYYDNDVNDWNWYVQIDDVSVTADAVPLVELSAGGADVSMMTKDVSVTVPISATNVGLGDFIFSIEEAPSFGRNTLVAGAANALRGPQGAAPDAALMEKMARDIGRDTGIVADGSFEAGTPNPFWNEADTISGSPICSAALCGAPLAYTGNYYVWFGGWADSVIQSVDQDVALPANADQLQFRMIMGASQVNGPQPLTMTVSVNGDVLMTVTEADVATYGDDYYLISLDVSAYAGQTVNLEFAAEAVADGAANTNVFIDDVDVTISSPCLAPSDVPWLSVDPLAGAIPAGETAVINVTFADAGLVPGTYTAVLCVTHNDPTKPNPVELPVSLTLFDTPPWPTLDRTSIEVTVEQDATATEMLDMGNIGDYPLFYETTIENGDGWLAVDPMSYLLDPGENLMVDVMFDATGVPVGSYPATIVFTTNSPVMGLDAVAVDVTMNVVAPAMPEAELSVSEVEESIIAGESMTTTMTMTNNGNADLTFTAMVQEAGNRDVSWLGVSPAEGTVAPGASAEMTMAIDASELQPGTYEAEVVIETNEPDGARKTHIVPVTLVVTADPTDVNLTALGGALLGGPTALVLVSLLTALAAAMLLVRGRRTF